ncbi:MAG: hypothetical protein HXY30_13325 [Pseudorhodoplanes sp.]|nr:hypothetical protein [Pseudorhodoplanes sp.]
MAGGDAKELARLQRFADEAAYHRSYRALEARLSSGEFRRALPENASAEELAAWRKDNGIPDKPEGYLEKLTLPDGLVLGEADKPVAESFARRALEKNWTPQQFNDAVGWYYENLEAQQAAQAEADAAFKQTSDDALRAEWQGADYRANLNAIQNLFAGWPKGLAEQLLTARTADGHILGNMPDFVKQMAALARELNPAAALVPAGGADPGKSLSDEIASIEKTMREKPDEYWNSTTMQTRYRELLEAQEKMQARAA